MNKPEKKLAEYSHKNRWIAVYLGGVGHCLDVELAGKLLNDLADALMVASHAQNNQ